MEDLERRIGDFENKCYRRMIAYYAEKIKQTNMYGNRSISSPDIRSFCCQSSSITSYHGLAMSAVMICCHKEDSVNPGRIKIRTGLASRCRHCCASQMTEVDGQQSQQWHAGIPQRRLGVMGIS